MREYCKIALRMVIVECGSGRQSGTIRGAKNGQPFIYIPFIYVFRF